MATSGTCTPWLSCLQASGPENIMDEQPVVLITGGSGGLAGALHEEFSASGWHVIAPGRETMDVTSADNVAGFFSGLNRLDLLINNAGIRRDALLAQQPETDRDAVLDVCLRGAFLCSREAARLMAGQKEGHILNVGSYSALTGPAGQSAYAAAKAGLIGFTKSLAAELGPSGVRVNCVLPGWLETNFTAKLPEGVIRRALEAHVLGKFSTPRDAARFICFLHGMTGVSGQVFQLDSRISR